MERGAIVRSTGLTAAVVLLTGLGVLLVLSEKGPFVDLEDTWKYAYSVTPI